MTYRTYRNHAMLVTVRCVYGVLECSTLPKMRKFRTSTPECLFTCSLRGRVTCRRGPCLAGLALSELALPLCATTGNASMATRDTRLINHCASPATASTHCDYTLQPRVRRVESVGAGSHSNTCHCGRRRTAGVHAQAATSAAPKLLVIRISACLSCKTCHVALRL